MDITKSSIGWMDINYQMYVRVNTYEETLKYKESTLCILEYIDRSVYICIACSMVRGQGDTGLFVQHYMQKTEDLPIIPWIWLS